MAYTSVLPVHRLERSIDYVKDRTKTTKSAGSLEEAIDYACNREKTEETIFEDAMGCTCENAYADMVKTKERLSRDYEEKSVNKIFYDNDRRKTGMKSAFRLCFIYNSYKIACQERAGNPPVFLTFFIIPVSVPHT